MQSEDRKAKTDALIAMLDEAVSTENVTARCHAVKEVLERVFRGGEEFIDPDHLRPCPTSYARRLIHRDPAGRYTVLAMVWGAGQGTALHDHAGHWCVECVYRGRIRVVSYDIQGHEDDPVLDFTRQKEVFAGIGEAGALIPPFDYHTIENAEDTPSVTVHVYGEELTWCHVFIPREGGGFERLRRELSYTA